MNIPVATSLDLGLGYPFFWLYLSNVTDLQSQEGFCFSNLHWPWEGQVE